MMYVCVSVDFMCPAAFAAELCRVLWCVACAIELSTIETCSTICVTLRRCFSTISVYSVPVSALLWHVQLLLYTEMSFWRAFASLCSELYHPKHAQNKTMKNNLKTTKSTFSWNAYISRKHCFFSLIFAFLSSISPMIYTFVSMGTKVPTK